MNPSPIPSPIVPVTHRPANSLVRKLSSAIDLSTDDDAALQQLCRITREVKPDSDIIRDGDRPDYMLLILDGWACRYKNLKNGSRQITAFLLPGDSCDMHVMLLTEMDHGIAALSPVKVAFLSREQLASLTVMRPHILRAFWWSTLVDEGILRAWLVNNGRRPAMQRVAHLICELRVRAQNVGMAESGDFAMPITQIEIADALGLTAVHVSRVVGELASRQLVSIGRGRVSIANVDALERLADFDPSYLHIAALRQTSRSGTRSDP